MTHKFIIHFVLNSLHSYFYIHWILDFKYVIYYYCYFALKFNIIPLQVQINRSTNSMTNSGWVTDLDPIRHDYALQATF